MRLLHAGSIQLESFEGDAIPPYAILSHTWGNDEVSFHDIQDAAIATSKAGYEKIKLVCADAIKRGLKYAWVDTCCIDKSSSAELSEAINSMFRWYRKAEYCYAYLADVLASIDVDSIGSSFATSRWFTRGWTLQELLAPKFLDFYSSEGQQLGSKHSLRHQVSRITGIEEEYLNGTRPLSRASISKRMSWASRRQTTRREDLAYCLLGIFDINMPLLYGEGEKAFIRLQEEIMKHSDDQTLFAWGYNDPDNDPESGSLSHWAGFALCSPFAPDPAAYQDSGDFIPDEFAMPIGAYAMTNKGLHISLRKVFYGNRGDGEAAVLACRPAKECLQLLAIPISWHFNGPASHYSEEPASGMRSGYGKLELVHRDWISSKAKSFYLLTKPHIGTITDDSHFFYQKPPSFFFIRQIRDHSLGAWYCKRGTWNLSHVEPATCIWDPEQRRIQLTPKYPSGILLHLWNEGSGYAILLRPLSGLSAIWESEVFREKAARPLSYEKLTLGAPDMSSLDASKDVNIVQTMKKLPDDEKGIICDIEIGTNA
jgi:Heterokaryon incompatibility protein (HET)